MCDQGPHGQLTRPLESKALFEKAGHSGSLAGQSRASQSGEEAFGRRRREALLRSREQESASTVEPFRVVLFLAGLVARLMLGLQ